MNTPQALAISLLLISASSCATVIDGTTQAVTINSNVAGAEVTVEGNSVGVTPWSGKIKRQRSAIATVSKSGYSAQTIQLSTAYNSTALFSLIWDYSTTDFLTGAMWEYSPNSYYVNLKPAATAEADFKRESSLMAFAMTYFGDLQTELAAGAGPKLNAMHSEFFSAMPVDQFITHVKAAPSTDTVAFGESVAGLLLF